MYLIYIPSKDQLPSATRLGSETHPAKDLKSHGMLREDIELDQNPEYLQNSSIDGRNIAIYFYAAGFLGLFAGRNRELKRVLLES